MDRCSQAGYQCGNHRDTEAQRDNLCASVSLWLIIKWNGASHMCIDGPCRPSELWMQRVLSMKVTYISHACLLIDTGVSTIATDPWFDGPAFCDQWNVFPKPTMSETAAE